MKLYTMSIESHRSQKETLLCKGSVEEIVEFINSVGDGDSIGKFERSDLEENGGNWGCPPENWSPEAPYYYGMGHWEYQGGFTTLKEALENYALMNEKVMLI